MRAPFGVLIGSGRATSAAQSGSESGSENVENQQTEVPPALGAVTETPPALGAWLAGFLFLKTRARAMLSRHGRFCFKKPGHVRAKSAW